MGCGREEHSGHVNIWHGGCCSAAYIVIEHDAFPESIKIAQPGEAKFSSSGF
jgi:hypothetical protein